MGLAQSDEDVQEEIESGKSFLKSRLGWNRLSPPRYKHVEI